MGAWRVWVQRSVQAVVLAAVLALVANGAPTQAATSVRTARLPMGLRSVDGAKQVIVVTSASSRSTVATLRAFEKVGGVWRAALGPVRARVGYNGWRAPRRRREGDGTTPEGIYALGTTIYGTNPNPGVASGYHRLVPGDYWDENPATGATYNTFQHSANADCADNPYGGATECLWLETAPYAYFAVIDFNVPAAGPFGSGIFLHVGTASPTAGCVAIARTTLVQILRWLRPSEAPRIVLAGPSSPGRY